MPIMNYTTSKTVDETMGEVMGVLRRRGVTRISSLYGPEGTPDGIAFTLRTEYGIREFELPVRTEGVLAALQRAEAAGEFASSRKAKGTFTTPEHAARVAWRIALDWLEAQAALIDAGLASIDEVMLPYMIANAEGQTVYEAYRSQQKSIES
jgi:hypothetical protein